MLTRILLALTLVMVAVHVGEWLLLGQLARTARAGRAPRHSPFTRALGLMNFLRFEALYYVALVAFWLFYSETVPGVWVFVLGVVHIGGWAAIELRQSLPRLEAVALIAARNPQDEGGSSGLRRVLTSIALFDAAEVLILLYIAWRLWTAG